MAKTTETKVRNMLNSVSEKSVLLQNAPSVRDADSLRAFGNYVLSDSDFINEFSKLINRIAEVVIWNRAWNNPLQFLMKDGEYGNSIEEIFVNTARIMGYDPYGDGADQWKRVMPDVRSMLHVMNVKFYTEQTVYDTGLKQAFLSFESFSSFFQGIITAMYNAISKALYVATKYVLARCVIDTGAPGTMVAPGSSPEEWTVALKTMTTAMTFLKPNYNSAGVDSFSTIDDLYLFVSPEFDARQDVEVLAYMFNVELGRMPYRKIALDDFWDMRYDLLDEIFKGGVQRFTDDEVAKLKSIKAILCDKNLLLLYDMHHSSECTRNKLKFYTNYYMHFWGTMSYSPFANMMVFAEGTQGTEVTSWKNPYQDLQIEVGRDNRFFAIPAVAYGMFTLQEIVEPTISGTGLSAIPGHNGWYQASNNRGDTATITYTKPENASADMENMVITVKIV